ncbi:MAG: PLP-dependent aminotransferase family protein [Rhizomicrobium sp.]|jgi:GntR family transcriptional regulator/MocR family aminotransferase
MFPEQSAIESEVGALRARRAPKYFRLVSEEETGTPIYEQLYQRVRQLILSGGLSYGARLASSRSLAASLGVSRNSVLAALDRLTSDGLLEARKGSGVYVAYQGRHSAPPNRSSAILGSNELTPFALGVPSVEIFPTRLWERLQSRRWKSISPHALHEGEPVGWLGLREAIAANVAMTRGLQCSPAQIIVTSCIAAGLDLAVRSLELTGMSVWMEDPGYNAAARSFQYAGVRTIPVPVGKSGIDVEAGRELAPLAKAVYVTPACQFPTNVLMSKSRRRALLAWAEESDSWILEDDFDWYTVDPGAQLRPLAAAPESRAIYFNTFNHLLFPSLRIAYLIVPTALVDTFARVQHGLHGSANIPNQMVLADFIAQGHLDAHMQRLKAVREPRRAALVLALETQLSDYLDLNRDAAGSHIVCSLKRHSVPQLLAGCASQNIFVEPMTKYQLGGGSSDQILLGYPGFSQKALAEAVTKLRKVFASLDSDSPS